MTDSSVKMSAQHQIKSQTKKKYGIVRKERDSLQDDSVWKEDNKGRSMTENHNMMSDVENVNKHCLVAVSSTSVVVSITQANRS